MERRRRAIRAEAERLLQEFGPALQEARDTARAKELAFAQALVRAKGKNEAARKAEARIATEREHMEADMADVAVRSLIRALTLRENDLSWLQTSASNLRTEMTMSGGG